MIPQSLDELFDEWESRYPGCLLVRDGVINPGAWETAPQRIVFLLKENNCGPRSFSARQAPEYQRDFRLLCNRDPWREIGQWAYALLHLPSTPDFATADRHFAEACRQIAVVNLKKIAGDNSSQAEKITEYARRDGELLQAQLAILDPDTVVCCGKALVFRLAQELFDDARAAEVVVAKSSGRVLRGPRATWFDYVHPRMRRSSRETKYRHLMELAVANNALQQTRARGAPPTSDRRRCD
jgi:hypothetical protein